MALETGYSARKLTSAGITGGQEIALSRPPVINRTWRAKYDTATLYVNAAAGSPSLSKKDRVVIEQNGIPQFHGYVVASPNVSFMGDGAHLEVRLAAAPFLLWKKLT